MAGLDIQKLVKRILRYGALAFGVVVLVIGASVLWLASNAGRAWVAAELSSVLDSADVDISVANIEGSLFSTFTLVEVTAADRQGEFVRVPEVTVDWSPTALLRGTLKVNALSSGLVDITRLPETSKREEADKPSSGLPVAIDIRDATLPINFEGVSYQAVARELTIAEGQTRGVLSVVNADRSDVAEASVIWDDVRERFMLNGRVRAKPLGLITGLLGLPAGDSLEADVTAEGTPDDWQGAIKAGIPQKLALDGEASGADGLWNGVLNLQGNALVPENLKSLVANETSIEFQVEPQGGRHVKFVTAVTSGALTVEAEGDGGLDGGVYFRDVAFSAAGADVRVAALAANDMQVAGTLNYTGGQLVLDYQAHAARVKQGETVLNQIDAVGSLQTSGETLSGVVERASLELSVVDVKPVSLSALRGEWRYGLQDQALAVRSLELTGDGVVGREIAFEYANGGLNTAAGELEVSAAFLAPWVGDTLQVGTLNANISSEAAADGFLLKADLQGKQFQFDDDALQALVGPAPVGATEVFLPYDKNGQVRLRAGRLTTTGIEAQLSGTYTRATDKIDLNIKGTVGREGQLGLEAMTLSGEAVFDARVEGTTAAPALTFTAGIDAFEGYGVVLDQPQLTATVIPEASQPARWVGKLKLEGGTPLGPTTLGADIQASKEAVFLENVAVNAPGAAAEGIVTWSQGAGLEANVQGSLRTIEDQDFDLKGNAMLSVQLKSNGGTGEVAASFDAEAVSFLRPGHFPLTLGKANGKFSFGWGDGPAGYQASFTGQDLTYGAQSLDVISVQGDSSGGDPLLAELSGNWGSRFTLSARVTPAQNGAKAEFLATYGNIDAATVQPVLMNWPEGGGISVEAEALEFAGGTASVSVMIKDDVASARLKLDDGDFTAVNLLQPGVLESGRVSADLTFERNAEGENGQAQVRFSNVTLPQWRVAAAPDAYAGAVSAKLSEGMLVLKGGISEAEREFGQLTGSLPYQRKEDGPGYEIRPATPLALDLSWRGDVAPVWLLARRPSHLLTGTLDGSLSLSGDLENPTFKGRLDLSDGHYEYEPLGLVAVISELQVNGTQDLVELTSLKASDGNGGILTGRGEFELSRALSFPGTLSVEMTDFRVARLDEIGGAASASLVYQRAEEFSTLTGQITTGKMQVAMPRELPRSVVEIDVIEINGEEELELAQAQASAAKSKPTQLAISVEVPGRFFFEGRGLQSEWEGDLLLSGTTDDPEISGTMQVKNGVFNFGSKAFDIVDGRLTFLGTARIDPDIAVTAIHKTATIEAQLQITGPASAPKIELSSIPDMPDDEIMARVLLGKSVSDLTALQLAELVGAMDTLRGGGSLDVVGRLRRGLGLDTLSLNRGADDDDGATTITGGKYLRKNIYLEVETSTVSSETATRLKIDISKNFLAETELGARQGSSLKLKWFWDY